MGKADRYRHLKYRRVSGAVVYRRLSLTRRAGGSDRRDPAAAGDAPRTVRRPAALATGWRCSPPSPAYSVWPCCCCRRTPSSTRWASARRFSGDQYGAGHWLSGAGRSPADRRADRLAADDRWVVLAPVALIVDPPLHQVTVLQAAGYLWLCLAGAMLAYGLWFRGLAASHRWPCRR